MPKNTCVMANETPKTCKGRTVTCGFCGHKVCAAHRSYVDTDHGRKAQCAECKKDSVKDNAKNEQQNVGGRMALGRVTVTVTSKTHLLDAAHNKDEEIEVDVFQTAHATVAKGFEKVLKDGAGYPIGKVSVLVSWPCYREEVPKVLVAVDARCRLEMRNTIAAVTGQAQQTREQSAPRSMSRPPAREEPDEPGPQMRPVQTRKKTTGPTEGGGVVLQRRGTKKEPM